MYKIDKVFKDLADLYELNRRIQKYRFKKEKQTSNESRKRIKADGISESESEYTPSDE